MKAEPPHPWANLSWVTHGCNTPWGARPQILPVLEPPGLPHGTWATSRTRSLGKQALKRAVPVRKVVPGEQNVAGVLPLHGGPGTHVLLQVELLLTWQRGADFGLGEVLEAAGALEGELGETERCGGSPCAPRPSSHSPLQQPDCSASQSSPGAMPVLDEFFWLSQPRPSCPNPTRATVCCEPPRDLGCRDPASLLVLGRRLGTASAGQGPPSTMTLAAADRAVPRAPAPAPAAGGPALSLAPPGPRRAAVVARGPGACWENTGALRHSRSAQHPNVSILHRPSP